MEGPTRSGWLVWARWGQREFATYTVACDTAEDAIATVMGMGFCFSRGGWVLTAERVELLPEARAAAV